MSARILLTLRGRKAIMSAETVVRLIEEMVDLKVQQHAELDLKPSPEVARILQEKRATDRRRLDQIRAELTRILGECGKS